MMKPTATTDKRAQQVILLHNEIMESLNSSLDKAVNIGRILSDVKPTIRHGEWLPWVEKNLPFSDQTARNYMKLYDRKEELKFKNVLNLREAYNLILQPKKEEKAGDQERTEEEILESFNRLTTQLKNTIGDAAHIIVRMNMDEERKTHIFHTAVGNLSYLKTRIISCLDRIEEGFPDITKNAPEEKTEDVECEVVG